MVMTAASTHVCVPLLPRANCRKGKGCQSEKSPCPKGLQALQDRQGLFSQMDPDCKAVVCVKTQMPTRGPSAGLSREAPVPGGTSGVHAAHPVFGAKGWILAGQSGRLPSAEDVQVDGRGLGQGLQLAVDVLHRLPLLRFPLPAALHDVVDLGGAGAGPLQLPTLGDALNGLWGGGTKKQETIDEGSGGRIPVEHPLGITAPETNRFPCMPRSSQLPQNSQPGQGGGGLLSF